MTKTYKNSKYLIRLPERLSFFSWPNKKDNDINVWIHAVSVGEFISVKPLLAELLLAHPEYNILVTTTTISGSELIVKYIEEVNRNKKYNIKHLYYPYDNRIICSNFLKKTKPQMAVFFETEIWPNMFKQIKKNNIKLYIINARLSNKSYLNYNRIRFYIKDILNKVDFIAAQSPADKNRFMKLGCNPDKISVYGNIKYNLKIPDDLDYLSEKYRDILNLNPQTKLVLIAASTHPGEEEIILEIYKKLKLHFVNLSLIIAPRHPERFEQVYNLCVVNKLIVVKYTDISMDQEDKIIKKHMINNFDVFLLNTIGQLLYFYNIADLAFIGGSMVDVGGHNPIEPAVLNVPTLIGSCYRNFSAVVEDLKNAGNLQVVNNKAELETNIYKILADKTLRDKMGHAAEEVISNNGNVLNNYLKLLLNYG